MIELHNITISRSGKKLFENFNLEIKPHQHWLIQGANGSGKTTLLELIAGVLHPQAGTVRYDFIQGDDWHERYLQRQEKIRYIAAHALQTFLSGYHGLFYQQRYYSIGDTHIPRVKDFFGDDLRKLQGMGFPDNLDIQKLFDLEMTRLSNGQLKKVLILHGLVKHIPTVLLLDYPLEGLDLESRKDLTDFIDHIASSFSIQIIMTDHHHELPRVISHRMVLDDFSIARIEAVEHHTGMPDKKAEMVVPDNNPENKTPVVEMKALTIRYGEKKIIENLNWTIHKGERWALTGRNGSGKTTLFSLIYADHPLAYSQKVYLFGKRRGSGESIWDIKKRINYLGPEQIHFLDPKSITLSGRQYILNQHIHGEDRLNSLIDFFEAKRFIEKPVRSLSSGELQVMLLFHFFMSDKELLLLDEPFQFLDPVNKQKTTEYLNSYLDSNITLVLITHYEEDMLHWTQHRMKL
jgi:molybdate transport system ATP-binding protein